MYAKPWLLVVSLSMIASAVSWADESVQLDKDFFLRLDQRGPVTPPTESFHTMPAPPPHAVPDTLKTPNGERLPPGTRQHEFNGLPYYVIPL